MRHARNYLPGRSQPCVHLMVIRLALVLVASLMSETECESSPTPPLLLLTGKQFPLDLAGGELTIHGQPVLINEKHNTGLGTGTVVWDGSVLLAKYLEARYSTMAGMKVVEVGCGPGVAGIAAAVLGAEVTLTDLEYALPNLQATVQLNSHLYKSEVKVGELDWFQPTKSTIPGLLTSNLIIGADVVWVEELIPPLASTLAYLSHGEVPVVLAHQTRSTRGDELLFSELRSHGFKVEVAPKDAHHPLFTADNINLLLIQPASKSGGPNKVGQDL